MNQSVPWRPVLLYCLLAFALLWAPFLGFTLAERAGSGSESWRIALGIAGPYSPLMAAVLIRTLISCEGFGDAHLRFRDVHWRYWLLALLLPFCWNGVQDALQLGLRFATIEWANIPRGLYRVPINLLGGLLIFIGEEFGWRSYLLEKLRPLGRWQALWLSGVIWSLWHAPLVLIPNVHYGWQMNLAGAMLALLIFVLLGFIFGWFYLAAGSVWPCVLMHSYNNLISLKLFSEAWTVKTAPTLFQKTLLAIAPVALVWLILFWKGAFTTEREVIT